MAENLLVRRLRRLIDFLGSGRLAVILLAASAVVLYLYLTIPQIGQGGGEREVAVWVEQRGAVGRAFQAMGLTSALGSPIFWVVYGALLVNLSVCMTRRASIVARLCKLPDRPPAPAAGWKHQEVAAPGASVEWVAEQLGRRGYRTLIEGSRVYGLRGRFASIGHWVFHAGMLAMLLGGGGLAAKGVPFGGSVGVGEGEPFDLHATRFVSANQEIDPDLPRLRFRLDRVGVELEPGGVKEFEVELTTPQGSRETLGINRPYRSTPYQVLVHGFGFMPGWVIANPRGRAIHSAWIKLLPYPLEAEDSFSLGEKESTLHLRFYPDHEIEGGVDRTRSQELLNPRFRARIVWRGQELYDGLLEPGERVGLEGGREFFFLPEIRKYGLLDVIEERAQTPVFACLGTMILGLLLRYGRIRKEVLVRLDGDALQLHGRGELFEHLFEEDLERLATELSRDGSGTIAEGRSA